jgi:hypothetical protein
MEALPQLALSFMRFFSQYHFTLYSQHLKALLESWHCICSQSLHFGLSFAFGADFTDSCHLAKLTRIGKL